jgi:hypothetical protein
MFLFCITSILFIFVLYKISFNNNMNKQSQIILFCALLFFSFSGCSCNNGGSENPDVEEAPPNKKEEMPDLVPTPTSAGKIKITIKHVRINTEDDDWLEQLGIEKNGGKVAVVNSLGPKLQMGDGIDKGLSIWALVEHIKTPWCDNPKMVIIKNYQDAIGGPVGRLAGLYVPFGCIFLVHGPNPKCTTSLEESAKAIEELYYDMLCNTPKTIRKIVVCAASTGKLAMDGSTIGDGPEKKFTKAQWIRHIYN